MLYMYMKSMFIAPEKKEVMYIMYLSGELCDLLLSLFLYSSELVPETSLTLMPAGLQLGWREGGREGGREGEEKREGGRYM